jgi:hypothetical protein
MRCERIAPPDHEKHAALAAHDQETAMRSGLGHERLVAVFAAATLLLNFPLLALWDRAATVFGLPLFPLALFLIWGGVIVLLAWLMESAGDRD